MEDISPHVNKQDQSPFQWTYDTGVLLNALFVAGS
jgi:hypothetical protein